VLILASGCSPADDATVVVASEPIPAPAPVPAPPQPNLDDLLRNVENVRPSAAQSQEQLNEVGERGPPDAPTRDNAAPPDYLPPQPPRRLVFQCTDDVTFAVRVAGGRLEAFPPGHSNGFVVLTRVPSEDGVHYTARDADFRAKDDLATLQVGRERYVDCVSNPAASVWQELPRPRALR
jgi:hypothetical protein